MVPATSTRVALAVLLLGILLVATVAPGSGAPPPRPLCDACGETFERTAAVDGVDLDVVESTATVEVHGNGSAIWTVRNRLGGTDDSIETIRTNEDIRTEIADGAMWYSTFLSAELTADDVLIMRYRKDDFAERSIGGTLRSGEFTREYGYASLDGLGADRLDVVAPEGMTVDRPVPDATVSADGRRMTLTEFDRGAIVTFVPDDTPIGPVLSALAIGSLLAPAVVTNTVAYVGLPAALFGGLAGAIALTLGRLGRGLDRVRSVADTGLVAIGGLLVTVGAVDIAGVRLLGEFVAPVVGVGVGLIALGTGFSRLHENDEPTARTIVVGTALGLLVAIAASVTVALAFNRNGLTLQIASGLPFLVPLFALLPAGYASGLGDLRLVVGLAVGGFALAMVPLTPFTAPSIGFGMILIVVAVIYGVGLAIVGLPFFVVGLSLADGGRGTPPADVPAGGTDRGPSDRS